MKLSLKDARDYLDYRLTLERPWPGAQVAALEIEGCHSVESVELSPDALDKLADHARALAKELRQEEP